MQQDFHEICKITVKMNLASSASCSLVAKTQKFRTNQPCTLEARSGSTLGFQNYKAGKLLAGLYNHGNLR